MALQPALQPDTLVAFLNELHDAIASRVDAGAGAAQWVQQLVDDAATANLTTGALAVPEYDPEEGDLDEQGKYAQQLHTWAYALTGQSAKARRAVSQLSDGETRGMLAVGPDQVSDLVAEVAERIAREKAEAER